MNKSIFAGLLGLAFSNLTLAAEDINLKDVVVTSSRFSDSSAASTINVKVITKEDIKNSPGISVPDVLRMQAGLNIISLYGNQGIDATVDSRGFGDSGLSNTLILLDGQRLNTIDSSNIQWSSIPLAAIDRIEIISGGGTVLYGDRATGGVINIITDKSGKSSASVTPAIGSYGYKSLDAYISEANDKLYFNTFLHTDDSNGWRDNSANKQWSVSGRGGLQLMASEAFIDYSIYNAENGIPGSITSSQFNTTPRFARKPLDNQKRDGFRLRPGSAIKLTDNIEFANELSLAKEHQNAQYISDPASMFISDRHLTTYSYTPRFKWSHGLGRLSSTSIMGLDLYHGKITVDNNGYGANADATQKSNALYLQNNTSINSNIDFTSGIRSQKTKQNANQLAFGDPLNYGSEAMSGSSKNKKTAYELAANYHENDWRTYAKVSTSFRFANTDELYGFDPDTYQPIFSGSMIKPQTSKNNEVGVIIKKNGTDSRITLYRMDVKDEIGYDDNLGANTNFEPTRHQGMEAELSWQILDNIKSKLSYAYTDATFKSGAYKNKKIPLVATNSGHAQILWDKQQFGNYVLQVNHIGQRFTRGDFTNSRNKLPSYTTLDLRANWDAKPISVSVSALNITNKIYSPIAIYSQSQDEYYFVPADGRALYLSARYDFK